MRGSLRTQITAAIKILLRIGLSRHNIKKQQGSSGFIHAVSSFEKIFERLNPLATWLNERGIKNLEALTPCLIAAYLAHRLAYHINSGNTRKSFAAELSAIAALERGLTAFSMKHRSSSAVYDFAAERNAIRKHVKSLPLSRPKAADRALVDPEAVIAALDDPKHKLMAKLQLYCGCRTKGVGAPRHWRNPFRIASFCGLSEGLPGEEWRTLSPPGEMLPVMPDPVTGESSASAMKCHITVQTLPKPIYKAFQFLNEVK